MLLKYLENLVEGNFSRWTHLARKINLQGEMKLEWDGEIHQADRRTSVPKSAKLATLSKKTPIHMFSCKFCWIFENNFFTELLRNSGSKPLRYYMRMWRHVAVTKNIVGLTIYGLVPIKRSYILRTNRQVCLSMYDLFVDTSHEKINEQSTEAAHQRCS